MSDETLQSGEYTDRHTRYIGRGCFFGVPVTQSYCAFTADVEVHMLWRKQRDANDTVPSFLVVHVQRRLSRLSIHGRFQSRSRTRSSTVALALALMQQVRRTFLDGDQCVDVVDVVAVEESRLQYERAEGRGRLHIDVAAKEERNNNGRVSSLWRRN